jgi:hypothetical protein
LFPVVLQNFCLLGGVNQRDDLSAVSIDNLPLNRRQFSRGLNDDCAIGIDLEAHTCRSQSIQHRCWMRRSCLCIDALFQELLIPPRFGSLGIDAPLSIDGKPRCPYFPVKRLELTGMSCAHFG